MRPAAKGGHGPLNGTPTSILWVGEMTEGRLFHTKHALGFGREPEQGGSEHERVYRKITANAASTVYDGFNPRRSNHGVYFL